MAALASAGCGLSLSGGGDRPADADWPVYGGSAAGDRYSPLDQVNAGNVANLRQVWRFDTGPGGLQTSPLVIDGVMYLATPKQDIVAVDAATGAQLWRHDAGEAGEQPVRGLASWAGDGRRRLFAGNGTYLIALDSATGRPVPDFGDGGKVDLREGLGRDPAAIAAYLTSPGIVVGDLIIVGFRTSEAHPAAPGAVRAYDVRTGKLRWTFNLIPRPGEAGHETWHADAWKSAGGANAWAGMVADQSRGIVYVPTGSAVDDFYGGDRIGDNLYANSLVALDARTGRKLWHFQGVHHDIWDRDFPSPPVLLTIVRGGRRIDAVAQPSKQGFLFVFDRVTGEPLFPIEERPVPQSDVPGERTSPTQPFALKPAPFARQTMTADMLTKRTPQAHAAALQAYRGMRSGGPFMPFAVGQDTIVFPGFDGGAEWGGPAVDRRTGILYINSNDIAWLGALAEVDSTAAAGRGQIAYQEQCSGCHGINREGAPPEFPSLVGVKDRLSEAEIAQVIAAGRGRMPGFPHIDSGTREAIVQFLVADAPAKREVGAEVPSGRSRYRFTGYRKFLDPDGYPAVAPPWGTLSAIDLNSGDYVWRVPLGEYPELAAKGLTDTGSENYGGPVVTAGGLVIIGATIFDRKLRAFDSRSGRLLWSANLPFAGVATPITYMAGGRQFIVIATSGSRDPKGPQGSSYVAFALPQ